MKYLDNLISKLIPSVPKQNDQSTVDSLPQYVVASNWKTPSVKKPHLLVHEYGESLEDVAQLFLSNFNEQKSPEQVATLAGEMVNQPGYSRPLRIVHELQKGHVVATDLLLRREGNDLYVKFDLRTRTMLTYLRWVWLVGIFLISLFVVLGIYLKFTGAKSTCAKDYADKNTTLIYPDSDPNTTVALVANRILNGYYHTDWYGFREDFNKDPELVDQAYQIINNLMYEIGMSRVGNMELFGVPVGQALEEDEEYLKLMSREIFANIRYQEGNKYRIPEEIFFDLSQNRDKRSYYHVLSRDIDEVQNMAFFMSIPGQKARLLYSDWLEESDLEEEFLYQYESEEYPKVYSRIKKIFRNNTTWHGPKSLLYLTFADPRGFLLNFSMPIMIISAVIGFLVWRSPITWLRRPCAWLGWILPDDYNAAASASLARIERVFAASLPVPRDQVTDLQSN